MGQLDGALTSVENAVAASDPARLRAAVPLLAEVERLLTAAQGLMCHLWRAQAVCQASRLR